jgi:signal transduction histidine kinase
VLGNGKLHGDPEQLRDLLANLLANAARYTERAAPRIEVMLGSASEPGDTPGDVRSGPDAAESVVTVRDDGIGIAQHHLDDIFDAFHRLHGRYEYGGGTGVGLTIARRIVERHGGAIWIESSPGHGTSVRFTLPAG